MLWNTKEDKINKIVKNDNELEKFIIKYCTNSKPKIGIEEEKIVNHFELIERYRSYYIKDKFISDILPLIDFPVVKKIYEFDELPPFFATRIPNINQPFHLKKLAKYKGDKNDIVSLLEIFGQKSINNPFELVLC